jgi:hypothetical protein
MEEKKQESVLMTEEEKKQFEAFRQAKAKKEAAEKAKANRGAYRELVNMQVLQAIPLLKDVSEKLTAAKQSVFRDFQDILDMKSGVMQLTKDNQKSHTFTDAEGRYRLTLGTYILDGYDDTVEDGISIVKEYISSLAGDDARTKSLVSMVLRLLSKDAVGNLKAGRVLQLRKLADESGNARFIEGVRIIEEAYRPRPSKTFLRAEERGDNNEWKHIPLGMTES